MGLQSSLFPIFSVILHRKRHRTLSWPDTPDHANRKHGISTASSPSLQKAETGASPNNTQK